MQPALPPTRRELALAALALAALGAAVFGAQVARGGFYWDDWRNAAGVHFSSGFFDALDQATRRPVWGYRPVLTILLVVKHSLFGSSKPWNIAAAVAFGVLTAWALYLLMRTLRAARVESGIAAALLLVFPWADSTRIWPTASMDTLAVALYLLGAVVAVRGLLAATPRRRAALTVASVALYLAAAWTYEVVTAAIAASVLLYLVAAPRRDALRRFALDLAVLVGALVLVVTGTTRHARPLHEEIHHAWRIAGQSFSLLARALVPVGGTPRWLGALLLVALAGAAALGWRRGRPELRRPLALAGFGAAGVVAGYVLFVPAERYYLPLGPGTLTRTNVLAAVGFAVLVAALLRIAPWLLLRARPAALATTLLLATAIAAGYVVKVAHDERDWQRSARVQAHDLAAVRQSVPHPRPGTTIYLFGSPSQVAPGVPAFSLPFDLKAAVQLQYDLQALAAYPIRGLDVIQCAPGYLYPTGGTYGLAHRAPYGRAIFVSVPTARAIPIGDRASCLKWRARLGAAHV